MQYRMSGLAGFVGQHVSLVLKLILCSAWDPTHLWRRGLVCSSYVVERPRAPGRGHVLAVVWPLYR